jgi:hypothetical protein
MTDQLESDLRAALTTRADGIPPTAGDRVRARDYRPRTRAIRPPVAAGAVTAAAAAVAAVAFIDLGTSTTPAFAGWTAKPTTARPAQTSDAVAGCKQRLAAIPGSAAAANVAKASGRPMSLPPLSSLSPVLSDTRGPFTFLVFANQTANATCISGPGFTSVAENNALGSAPPVPATGIGVTWSAHTARAGQAYSFLEGHTGSDVSAVTLTLSDGRSVQASSQNGWFVAWWPGTADAKSAVLTTAQGTTTAGLPAAATAGCPPAPGGRPVSCTTGSASASGSATAGATKAGVGSASGMTMQSSSGS